MSQGAQHVAVVLRHQKINNIPREPGDLLTLEEYEAIPFNVRDAMESTLEIKKILDVEAVRVLENMDARLTELETKFAQLES